MNFQPYIYHALYLIQLFLIYTSSVCGEIKVFSPGDRNPTATFSYWEIRNRSPDDDVRGSVAVSHPLNACEPISHRPHPANSTYRWFVLILGCNCSLDLKFRMAEEAGYDLVILYPCEKHQNSVHDNNSTIEGILVRSRDWEIIREKFLWYTGYYLEISPDNQINLFQYIIPFVIAVGICMVLLMVFVLVKYIRERRRNRRNRLSSRHLKQLPVIKFKKGDHYDVCAICLEEYNEGNKLRVLPCSHAYHTKCIDPWLLNSQRTCPVCKQKVRLTGDSPDSESDSESEAPSEITPLLRAFERRSGLSRRQVSNRNFRRNPVINTDQQDFIQNGSRNDGESSQTYNVRPILEAEGPFLSHLVDGEHPTSESDNNSAYSSSAPSFLPSTATENYILNQPCTSSEQPSSLPNITPPTSHVEVVTENSRKERKTTKDMVV